MVWNPATGNKPLTYGYKADPEEARKRKLGRQANQASAFADLGQAGYSALGDEMAAVRGRLGELASGKNSLATEQLRQGLQQQQAMQRSAAASAMPNNAAMAARIAANNMGRNAYGMAGQAAQAQLAERMQANQLLGQMGLQQRGQDLQAALGSRGNAITALGAGQMGPPEKSWLEKYGPTIVGGLGAASGF
jgi:hypothetical protein